jgi:MraZ protein
LVLGGNKWEIEKSMLLGEYKHTIDTKNRLSLPVKFRKELGKTVVVTPGLDHCLFVFTQKEWKQISDHLSQFSILQADNRSFNRFMFGGASEAQLDSIGRILIPDHLREWAGLKQKATVIGVQSRLEVWDEDSWSKYKKNIESKADTLAEKLGSTGLI